MRFSIQDANIQNKSKEIQISRGKTGFEINFEGLGTNDQKDGPPVYIELQNDNFVVYVWGDINSPDPTNSISLKNAKEELYKEEEIE